MAGHVHSDKLRALADLLDEHPDFDPYDVGFPYMDGPLTVHHYGAANWADIRRTAMGLGGHWRKVGFDQETSSLVGLQREVVPGVVVEITAMRGEVCERVPVGNETVTIPAKPAEPERTEVVTKYEWRCAGVEAA